MTEEQFKRHKARFEERRREANYNAYVRWKSQVWAPAAIRDWLKAEAQRAAKRATRMARRAIRSADRATSSRR